MSQNVYTAAWMIKPVYGYLSDNYAPMGKALGFRRPYVFWGTLLGGLSFALLPSIAPTGAMWSAYLFIVFTRSFGVAIADAAVDGLLIDADVGSYGSFAQGVMNSGRSVGELIFGRSAAELAGNNVSANAWYLLAAGIWLATPFAFAVKVRYTFAGGGGGEGVPGDRFLRRPRARAAALPRYWGCFTSQFRVFAWVTPCWVRERCRALSVVSAPHRARVPRTSLWLRPHLPTRTRPPAAQEERLSKEVFKWSEMRVLLTLPVIMVRAREVLRRAWRAVLRRLGITPRPSDSPPLHSALREVLWG